MKRSTAVIGALTLGLGMALAAPTAAVAEESATLYVPDDVDFSQTRVNGHYEVTETGGLRIYTDSNTTTDKVAGYVATSTPLADVGEPSLEFDNTTGKAVPGFQLVIDVNGDDLPDGILVGEPVYDGDWWLSGGSAAAQAAAPVVGGSGFGGTYHGTLDAWQANLADADVLAFGFSLGSGLKGDGIIEAINFAGTRYTFAEHTVLADKNACKNDGWRTSTKPVFKNQGDCVSNFATTQVKLANFRR
jgi:hypothetical protein